MSTGLQTTSFDWQNNYIAHLSSDITSSATDVFLDTVPTVTEGMLVIDPDTPANLEVILFTSKTATKVVCHAQGRGYDGSTAIAHTSGTKVIMAPVADMFRFIKNQATLPSQGWSTGVSPAYSSATYNGNRSYDVTHASTMAAVVSVGQKARFTRTVAAPTYMGGAFNGTTHYFTKVTCTSTLSTVADNFTIMGNAYFTGYNAAQAALCGRMDAASNNGFILYMEISGQVALAVLNGGAANFRTVTTYQSLPANKKVAVAASWASGTVVIYFDGVSVPVAAATTGGTAPTTAGTGGDFSIGRQGAANSKYWAGYLSGFGVFNAVLTAATIKSYIPQVLSGSETNCIGAWSLNNTGVNQQAAGTNDLAATNSVGYTNISPYSTGADGAPGTYDYGIATKVAAAVVTYQVPEGCAIPTSGGVSAIDISPQKVPFGFPVSEGRWLIESTYRATQSQAAPVLSTWYNIGSEQLSAPIGEWIGRYEVVVFGDVNATSADLAITLSAANNTESDLRMSSKIFINGAISIVHTITRSREYSNTTATIYYLNGSKQGGTLNNLYFYNQTGASVISFKNAYL